MYTGFDGVKGCKKRLKGSVLVGKVGKAATILMRQNSPRCSSQP